MPLIRLFTEINAPIERVFDLARSIDVHKNSTKHTNETAIAGKTSGLIELHDTVTWRAKHLGFYQTLTSKITQYNRPYFFEDCMLEGIFKGFQHQHIFEKIGDIIGKEADKLFLENYMRNLLIKRNQVIKEIAEGEDWREVLKD
jgi:ligand-binding SRPBCC domain-containing protein